MEDWQTKREVPEPRLTTGFLDGIVPIVDSYELKVSLFSLSSPFSFCLLPFQEFDALYAHIPDMEILPSAFMLSSRHWVRDNTKEQFDALCSPFPSPFMPVSHNHQPCLVQSHTPNTRWSWNASMAYSYRLPPSLSLPSPPPPPSPLNAAHNPLPQRPRSPQAFQQSHVGSVPLCM